MASPKTSGAESFFMHEVSEVSLGEQSKWGFWYPSWDAWKFQRTLTYWIAVMYLEGSILFLIGAIFSMTSLVEEAHGLEMSLVQTPYLAGGICFTIGSYFGILEVIKIKTDGNRMLFWPCGKRWLATKPDISKNALAGYSFYLGGALFYNVNTSAGYFELTPLADTVFNRMAAFLGASGLLVGSMLEGRANKIWRVRLTSIPWWLCVHNLVGSLGFLIAGVGLLCKLRGAEEVWFVDFWYAVGSAEFMFGSLCTMWLWKAEQYGLGFMPEMNMIEDREEPGDSVLSLHAEYGCGRASIWQLPFLTMYLMNASASVLDIGIALFQPNDPSDSYYQIFEAFLNFALSHGVMLLGSVIHHIPTARPHSWLLVYMRIVLTLYTVKSWISVFRSLGF